jgi:hypothetical protein
MTVTRTSIIAKLREIGQPISAADLSRHMQEPRYRMKTVLASLHTQEIVLRVRAPGETRRFLYRARPATMV